MGVTWSKNRHQDVTRKMFWINDPTCFCWNEYLQPYIIYHSKHHGAEKWNLEFGSTPLDSFSNTTQKANDPTGVCLTEYLQPYISPNVFTFPSMAVCVFWIYGKGKYLWHSTAPLRANEQSIILLILCRHLLMVNTEVVRRHEGPLPKSLDSDKNFKR